MRKILMPAVLAGLLVSACGDSEPAGGNGGGGDSPAGGGGTGGIGAQGGGGMGAGGMGAGGMGAGGMGAMGAGGTGGMVNPVCGDGTIDADETCDDGNMANGDGCDAMCEEETGFDCTGEPSDCTADCGDGVIAVGAEDCDDSNMANDDGCSDTCAVETGWSCMGEPSVCMTGCGDGIIAGTEACDDMDMMSGDGCSDVCAVELGFVCNGEPSVCALGGTCMAPIVVTGDGFVFASADITPFGDDLTLTDVSCSSTDGSGPEPDLVFSVVLAAGETLQIAESGTIDGVLHVTQGCTDTTVCLESFDGIDMSEIDPGLVFQAPMAGTYTVIFDSWVFTAGDTLDLLFNISPCGDGTVGPGEACDDMNVMGGDGCSATCTIEAGFQCTGTMPSVCTPLCGNGVLNAGETCDDMDQMGGDGCSATCTTEMGFICTGAPSVCTPVPAASCMAPIVATDGFAYAGTSFGSHLDDLDYADASCADVSGATFDSPDAVFSIALTAGQRVRVRNNAAQPDLDTVIQALGTTCAGSVACLGEFDDPEATGLTYLAATTGTHFFVVESFSATPPVGDNYSIQFDVATCGDGAIEFGEACDQGMGNVANGDGCSSTCTIEPGFMCSGTPSVCTGAPPANCATPIVASNGFTFAGSNIASFGDDLNFQGAVCQDVAGTPNASPELVFSIALTAGQTLNVRNFGTLDTVTQLVQPCGAGMQACLGSFDGFPVSQEQNPGFVFTAATTGTYFVAVESFSGTPAANLTFDIRFSVATCGNGVIEGAESCDDNNTMTGDGCNATCGVEAGFACDAPGGAGSCFSTALCGDNIMCYLGPCAGGTIVTGSAMGLPAVIPDNVPAGGAILNIPIMQAGTVRKMAMRLRATHTFDGDLDFFLTSPATTVLDVCTDNGGTGDNFGNMMQATFLRDGVPTAVTAGVAPFAGVFRPEAAFSTVTTQPVSGTWSLRAADDAAGDTGSVTAFDLAFCVNP